MAYKEFSITIFKMLLIMYTNGKIEVPLNLSMWFQAVEGPSHHSSPRDGSSDCTELGELHSITAAAAAINEGAGIGNATTCFEQH